VGVARTTWYSDQIPVTEEADPFEVPVEDVGELIDLSHPTARLNVRLKELLNREGHLDSLGITCDLKDKPDVLCSVCPVSRAGDHSVPLGALCRVGREQESICTQLAVEGSRDTAPR
jgi:hypothetical protein